MSRRVILHFVSSKDTKCIEKMLINLYDANFRNSSILAKCLMVICIGYFGIRDIDRFFKGFWDICVFYFEIWDIQEFWDMGYWNLFWDKR